VHQSPKAFIDLLKTNGQHRFELSNREGKKVENKSMHCIFNDFFTRDKKSALRTYSLAEEEEL
jgi:hypothetical protein